MKKPAYLIATCSFILLLLSCNSKPPADTSATDKNELLSLEKKWLAAEFSLDTAYLSSIIDPSFVDISENGVHNKPEALADMYRNISQRTRDSIFIDSFLIEEPIVHVHPNSAVVVFVVHTFRRDKGVKTEHKTRFYDVWIKQDDAWKAVGSQGTKIE